MLPVMLPLLLGTSAEALKREVTGLVLPLKDLKKSDDEDDNHSDNSSKSLFVFYEEHLKSELVIDMA
ncbi:hypothetical protein Ccrd_023202 [Cynara cardunculus var. scolymus]|uniref:Uncharacterized protein n=1 Tax=Cynara cardunculus var. scolymus TaxID=59895 RepID=A0A124SE05_CYNCS|nr:hypothetical protein Ccrd_023202 [Cynara cardunculus var. scolymus]